MKFQLIYLWVIVFVLSGCESTKTISAENTSSDTSKNQTTESHPTKIEKPYLIVSFEQTACFGTCPVHKLTIFSSGQGNYHGDRNVEHMGDFMSDISVSQIQEIIAKADSLNFFDLKDSYAANMTDLPTTIIYINDGEQKKKVVAYGNYPDNLKVFITYLYDFSQSLDWQANK